MVDVTEGEIRNLRDESIWVRYDSVLIGQDLDNVPGWNNNFAQFANREEIRFNDGSRTEGTAGPTYCNQSGDTEDWAQDIYSTRVEFFVPFGDSEFDSSQFDSAFGPFLWLQELPRRSSFEVKLADADSYLKVPGVFLPSNTGVEGASIGGNAGTFAIPGHTGQAALTVGWVWPEPLRVPAKGKIVTIMRLGQPIRQFLSGIGTLPGVKSVPIPAGPNITVLREYPNFYGIRVSHWGPRYLQLRGARSS